MNIKSFFIKRKKKQDRITACLLYFTLPPFSDLWKSQRNTVVACVIRLLYYFFRQKRYLGLFLFRDESKRDVIDFRCLYLNRRQFF